MIFRLMNYVSRNVNFHELVFPFKDQSISACTPWQYVEPGASSPTVSPTTTTTLHSPPLSPPIPHHDPDPNTTTSLIPAPTRKSSRPTKRPSHLNDFHCNLTTTYLSLITCPIPIFHLLIVLMHCPLLP